jgi:hypothetical protein
MLPITQVVQLLSAMLALFPDLSPGARNFMNNVVAQMPDLEKSGYDVVTYFQDHLAKFEAMVREGRDPTDEEWAALASDEEAEMGKLHGSPQTP